MDGVESRWGVWRVDGVRLNVDLRGIGSWIVSVRVNLDGVGVSVGNAGVDECGCCSFSVDVDGASVDECRSCSFSVWMSVDAVLIMWWF